MTLPQGWVETTVGEVVQPIETANPADEPDNSFRYVDIGSIDNRLLSIAKPKEILGRDAPSRARRRIRSGDILFSTVRPYLKNIAQVPADLDSEFTSTGICVLRGHEGVESGFLFRRVASQDFIDAMTLASDGTMYPAISDNDVFSGAISLPPAAEQRRIVAKLDALTARLARARAELDRVPVLAMKLRQSALSDIRGRVEAAPSMRLADIAVTTFDGPFGSNLKSADYSAEGVRVVRLENIGHLRFVADRVTHIPEEKYAGLTRHTLKAGDILFSSFVDQQVRVCRFPSDVGLAINKADCFAIRVAEQSADPRFITYMLASAETYDVMRANVHGATRPRVGLAQVREYALPVPSLADQRAFADLLDAVFARADRMEAEADRARALIDRLEAAILAKAFRGELVPQDPNDEPASVLLDRIRAQRAAAPTARRGRKKANA